MAVTDTAVYSWGSNKCGQLGTRTFQDKNKPTEITDLAGKHVTQVACGTAHTVFLCRYACVALVHSLLCTWYGLMAELQIRACYRHGMACMAQLSCIAC